MAGFGRAPFGTQPFGLSDTGQDLVVQSFPTEYFAANINLDAGQTDPLLEVLNTYANSVFQRRLNVDDMEQLTDPDTMPLDIVELWGGLLGLGIDKNDPDFLQRTFLKTASQWLQIKASTKGYEVRGLASGFAVEVDTFWRVDPQYAPFIPLRFQFFLKPTEADDRATVFLYTDKPPGTFPGTPTVEDNTYAKSSFVQPIFSVPIYRPNTDYNTLLNLVILKIKDVVGIHQELLASIFQVILNVDASKITVEIVEINESIEVFEFSEACYFDIIPSDYEPTDSCLGTVYILDDEIENIPVNAIPTISMKIEEKVVQGLSVSLSPMTGTFNIEETAYPNVEFQNHFDTVPADYMALDQNPWVSIEQAA